MPTPTPRPILAPVPMPPPVLADPVFAGILAVGAEVGVVLEGVGGGGPAVSRRFRILGHVSSK